MEVRQQRTVTLYTRPGCHLCTEAALLLARLAEEYPLCVVERDVSTSVELERRYGWLIPVVQVEDGQELCAPIVEADVRAALEAASRAEP